jgi:predicted nucleotidyltransferase
MQSIVQNKASLLQELNGHANEIKNFGVKRLGLFGSFAKDININDDSDIDFLIEFEQGKETFDNFMELSFYLEEILGRKIELVTPKSLSKYIGPHILKEVENVGI